MPMDGLMLRAVIEELAPFIGAKVEKIQQPERDEIHMHLHSAGGNARLLLSASANHARVHLTRINKKSPDVPPAFLNSLRKHLGGARITSIEQLGNDRVLFISLDSRDELGDMTEKRLTLEIMGKHSNITLIGPDGRIIDCARRIHGDMSRVRQLLPGLEYAMPPGQGKLNPYETSAEALAARLSGEAPLSKRLSSALEGLSIQSAREIAFRATNGTDAAPGDVDDAFAERVLTLLRSIKTEPTVISENGAVRDVSPIRRLSEKPEHQRAYPTPSEALEVFFAEKDNVVRIAERSLAMRRTVTSALERAERKLQAQLEKLEDSKRMETYRRYGETLLAHTGRVPKAVPVVRLVDYSDPDMAQIDIPMDVSLSPQDNAARYFKLYNKSRAALKLLDGQIAATRADIAFLSGVLHSVGSVTSAEELGEIREELVAEGILKPVKGTGRHKPKAVPPTTPHVYRSAEGFDIFVGKNNAQNDAMLRAADGTDMWLHVKNAPGSHVIIRAHGKPVPDTTLVRAARLAAYHSSQRGGDNVQVDATLRKYVKKPGGAKPGFVIFTDQRTLSVKPGLE